MVERVCAVMLEPLQGEGGVIPAPAGYLEAVRDLCDEREALLIVDEVQTGLGRTGRWFGFQHADIVPDVVTMAKALGNGMPIGACWAREDAASALRPGDHATTFGGQPLAARTACAVLDVMQEVAVPDLAEKAGARLSSGLALLRGVTSVRGLGLLLGAELEPGLAAGDVVSTCLDRGLVVNAVTPTTIRLAPPLLVSDEEIDDALGILGGVLEEAA
jgi:acetylornithine/succinyldiaminopimelate/putrescine aminotransferase